MGVKRKSDQTDYEQQLQQLKKAHRKLQKDFAQRNQEAADMRIEAARFMQENGELKRRVETLSCDYLALKKQLDEALKERARFQQELLDLSKSSDEKIRELTLALEEAQKPKPTLGLLAKLASEYGGSVFEVPIAQRGTPPADWEKSATEMLSEFKKDLHAAGTHIPQHPSQKIEDATPQPSNRKAFEREIDAIAALLKKKNAAYGDSVLNPVRVLSEASVEDAIRVRIDDKLSRLKRGQEFPGEDVLLDLAGYFLLWKLARARDPK